MERWEANVKGFFSVFLDWSREEQILYQPEGQGCTGLPSALVYLYCLAEVCTKWGAFLPTAGKPDYEQHESLSEAKATWALQEWGLAPYNHDPALPCADSNIACPSSIEGGSEGLMLPLASTHCCSHVSPCSIMLLVRRLERRLLSHSAAPLTTVTMLSASSPGGFCRFLFCLWRLILGPPELSFFHTEFFFFFR